MQPTRNILLLVATLATVAGVRAQAAVPEPPETLAGTGLYADAGAQRIRADILPFSPQYPLWSDGARKRRWIHLPAGSSIDASDPDAWQFPVGTRLWKEFGYGRPVETRYIERLADGSWRFLAYVWNDAGTEARLAPEGGAIVPVRSAPGGRYAIPARADCLACHEGGAVPVLGFSALQLSPDRDLLAPHAEPAHPDGLHLPTLVARGMLRGLPPSLLEVPPRIAAPTPQGRAALGYLHANCGHCHNDAGPLAALDLALAQSGADPTAAWQRSVLTLLAAPGRYRAAGLADDAPRVRPGHPDASVLLARMRSRNPLVQMPPIGTQQADAEGLARVERWIRHDLSLPLERNDAN